MQKGLVTVVVPVYNTEKYLDRCITSIVNQTYHNLEIILVDDGSPDNCPHMCDEWAKKDNRIKVVHKENQGLGMARNTGIEHARGEYICFFDSDDYVAVDTIEKSYAAIERTQAEVVLFGLSSVNSDGDLQISYAPKVGQDVYKGEQVQNVFLAELIAPNPKGNGERMFYMSACVMLYSMTVILNCGWRFVSEREIISEDVYSLLSLFRHVNSVAIIPEALYYYRVNEVSVSRRYQKDRYSKIRYFYEACIQLCEQLGYSEDVKHRVSKPFLAYTMAAMKQEMAASIPYDEKKRNIRAMIDDDVVQQVLAQNKEDKVSKTRKIMFFAMRNKLYWLCALLLKARLKSAER